MKQTPRLQPVDIGPIRIDDPVILAPLSGVSDMPFRQAVKRNGAGLVVSEMIASAAMVRENRKTLLMAKNSPEEFPMSVQLAGCEPQVMADAAKLNEDRGAAIIDINFGCPVKKVVNGHAGSSLMRDEVHAAKILEATVNAVKLPVTLKMRTGWDQTNRNAPTLARIAENCGIKLLTIHGRTRCQFYDGRADWGFIREVKAVTKLPVIANGDISTLDDVDQAQKVPVDRFEGTQGGCRIAAPRIAALALLPLRALWRALVAHLVVIRRRGHWSPIRSSFTWANV